jgi:lipid-binding SYLF domain-containing protein
MNRSTVLAAGIATILLLIFTLATIPVLAAGDEKIQQQREDIRKMANDTLARLYKTEPAAKKSVEKAAGYAVFSNFGMKIFLAGGGSGSGIAVNNKSKQESFMKMVEIQAGLGFGVKKFRLVWVFENQGNLDTFINSGWELGGQTTAAAQVSGQGGAFAGAMSISPGVWLYQLTDDGLALELTAKGTKYYKDADLN